MNRDESPNNLTTPKTAPSASPSGQDKTFTNSIGMEFVLIPAGKFRMGFFATGYDMRREATSPRPFYLGKYPVTQAQWQAVMRENPSSFKRMDHPVECVSWEDAQAFIAKLNTDEGHDRYRLPTEAEWEYACRAGGETMWCFGDDVERLGDYAWFLDNAGRETHPVGQKLPNAWGLHDMHGNVLEWVQDSDHSGVFRVARGGSYLLAPGCCRSGDKILSGPDLRGDMYGFRLALSLDDKSEDRT